MGSCPDCTYEVWPPSHFPFKTCLLNYGFWGVIEWVCCSYYLLCSICGSYSYFISNYFWLLVGRERAERPFRCLDCQYRRELVPEYLTNVERNYWQFLEEKRSKLGKLMYDKARWSRYCVFTFIKYSLELWI